MAELEEMVRRMVWESLGVAKDRVEQSESTLYHMLRFAKYGEEKEGAEEKGDEVKLAGYEVHRDTNALSLVCQLNEVDGLEVEIGDDEVEWVLAKPSSPASIFVLAGNAIRVSPLSFLRVLCLIILLNKLNHGKIEMFLFTFTRSSFIRLVYQPIAMY